MKLVVSDTSPIRALKWLGLLELLESLYGKVLIPPAVVAELVRPAEPRRRVEVDQYKFIEVVVPRDQSVVEELAVDLDPGEAEALALALEQHSCRLVIDERAGREKARALGLDFVGTVGIVIQAKQAGLIPAVQPIIEQLRNELNFFLSEKFVLEILKRCGESTE
ncbi:MAG: DUF3368 domain-containing protein [Planctomycetaceae bacterium]